ncbi:MAG: hypothetical protein ACREI7_05380, partial [Myxococcota bacterium]
MAVVFRLAWREIRNHPRFALFFAVNLALGFAGFVALDAFEDSVARALTARSQAYLGADVAITSSRPLREQEIAALDAQAGAGARFSRAVVLFSMAGAGARARLREAVERNEAGRLEQVGDQLGDDVRGDPRA